MPTKKFPKDVLKDLVFDDYDPEEYEIVLDEIEETTRWSILNRLVFKHGDEYWQTFYSRGATEYQDEAPFEYSDDEVECWQVKPVEITVTEYVKVK